MKAINKILISILIMSILITAVVTSAKDTDNAVSVSTNTSENIVNPTSDTPVAEIEEVKLPTPAEEKARFENRIKNIPRNLENKSKNATISLPEQIATIPSDVAYSNPITGVSTFAANFNEDIYDDSFQTWKTYTFYLPVASYVYTDISGQIDNFGTYTYFAIYIDSDYLNFGRYIGSCNSTDDCYLPIQKSRLTYLPKGWHTLYINGMADLNTLEHYTIDGYISIMAFPEYTAITVTSPNGYENWYRGQTKSITWAKYGQPGANVKIELYKSGVLSSVISSLTPDDGIYSWYTPTYTPVGTDYKIKITSTSDSKYNDWSNNNFKIS